MLQAGDQHRYSTVDGMLKDRRLAVPELSLKLLSHRRGYGFQVSFGQVASAMYACMMQGRAMMAAVRGGPGDMS